MSDDEADEEAALASDRIKISRPPALCMYVYVYPRARTVAFVVSLAYCTEGIDRCRNDIVAEGHLRN